jgi:hypothetical protein
MSLFLLLLVGISYSNNLTIYKNSLKRIRHKEKTVIIKNASASEVFDYMDRIGNTGEHMTKKSMAMMGSKLKLAQLSSNANEEESDENVALALILALILYPEPDSNRHVSEDNGV